MPHEDSNGSYRPAQLPGDFIVGICPNTGCLLTHVNGQRMICTHLSARHVIVQVITG